MRGAQGPDLSGMIRIRDRVKAIGQRFAPNPVPESTSQGRFVDVLDGTRSERRDPEPVSHVREVQGVPGQREALPGRSELALDEIVRRKSRQYGVDEALVRSVIEMESGGNPRAVSKAGARGLMQLMPATARMLGVDDSFDPEQNVDGGVRYLREMLERYGGDETRALAAYHSGPGNVDRYGGVPPFPAVRHYVKCVGAMARRQRQETL